MDDFRQNGNDSEDYCDESTEFEEPLQTLPWTENVDPSQAELWKEREKPRQASSRKERFRPRHAGQWKERDNAAPRASSSSSSAAPSTVLESLVSILERRESRSRTRRTSSPSSEEKASMLSSLVSLMDGHSVQQSRDSRRRRNTTGTGIGIYCAFCKNNGEMPEFYQTHRLKDDNGLVSCPILRAYKCPLCGALGDYSHTINYCPENKKPKRERKAFSSSKSAIQGLIWRKRVLADIRRSFNRLTDVYDLASSM